MWLEHKNISQIFFKTKTYVNKMEVFKKPQRNTRHDKTERTIKYL